MCTRVTRIMSASSLVWAWAKFLVLMTSNRVAIRPCAQIVTNMLALLYRECIASGMEVITVLESFDCLDYMQIFVVHLIGLFFLGG